MKNMNCVEDIARRIKDSDGGKVESLGIWELIEKLRGGGRELRRCMQKEVGNEDFASFLPEHEKWKLVLS